LEKMSTAAREVYAEEILRDTQIAAEDLSDVLFSLELAMRGDSGGTGSLYNGDSPSGGGGGTVSPESPRSGLRLVRGGRTDSQGRSGTVLRDTNSISSATAGNTSQNSPRASEARGDAGGAVARAGEPTEGDFSYDPSKAFAEETGFQGYDPEAAFRETEAQLEEQGGVATLTAEDDARIVSTRDGREELDISEVLLSKPKPAEPDTPSSSTDETAAYASNASAQNEATSSTQQTARKQSAFQRKVSTWLLIASQSLSPGLAAQQSAGHVSLQAEQRISMLMDEPALASQGAGEALETVLQVREAFHAEASTLASEASVTAEVAQESISVWSDVQSELSTHQEQVLQRRVSVAMVNQSHVLHQYEAHLKARLRDITDARKARGKHGKWGRGSDGLASEAQYDSFFDRLKDEKEIELKSFQYSIEGLPQWHDLVRKLYYKRAFTVDEIVLSSAGLIDSNGVRRDSSLLGEASQSAA
jgi:hypothetical protein